MSSNTTECQSDIPNPLDTIESSGGDLAISTASTSLQDKLHRVTSKHSPSPSVSHQVESTHMDMPVTDLDKEASESTPSNTDPVLPPADPNCSCQTLISSVQINQCQKCLGLIIPIDTMVKEQVRFQRVAHHEGKLKASLEKAKKWAHFTMQHNNDTIAEKTLLKQRNDHLEKELMQKTAQLKAMTEDLDRLNDKLVDAVEQRAEAQHAKEAIQEELEDLTKNLFEEANHLVADERKKRFEHETHEKLLQKQVESLESQQQLDEMQIRELKEKMGQLQEEVKSLTRTKTMFSGDSNESVAEPTETTNEIDPEALQMFREFFATCPTVKQPGKLLTLPFVKDAIEEDVEPCLRFKNCSKAFTKRIVETVSGNLLIIEEISCEKVISIQSQHVEKDEKEDSVQTPSQEPARHSVASVPGSPASEKRMSTSRSNPSLGKFRNSLYEHFFASSSPTPTSVESKENPACATCSNSITPRYHFSFLPPPQNVTNSKTTATPNLSPTRTTPRSYYPVCSICRKRLITACHFFNMVRNVQLGLYNDTHKKVEDLWWEFVILKRNMFWARCGVIINDNMDTTGDVVIKPKSVRKGSIGMRPLSMPIMGEDIKQALELQKEESHSSEPLPATESTVTIQESSLDTTTSAPSLPSLTHAPLFTKVKPPASASSSLAQPSPMSMGTSEEEYWE